MHKHTQKKLTTILRCLNEAVLREEPEAATAPFGKYAFDQHRTDEIPLDQQEPPTETEESAFRALYDYIVKNQKPLLDRSADLLLSLVKKGLYKPVLDPTSAKTVYRVLFLDSYAAAERILGPLNESDKIKGYGVVGGGVLEPLGSRISGWTTEKNLALDFETFVNGLLLEGPIIIVFKASIKGNNFFGKPGHLAAVISTNYAFASEMETVAVGPVTYSRAVFANGKNALKKALRLMSAPLKEEPEPEGAPFGKYAFDDERPEIPETEREQPTPDEKEAYSAIASYVSFNRKSDLDKSADLLLSLVKKGLYKPVLDPGDGLTVYRILLLSKAEDIQEIVPASQEDIEEPYGLFGPGILVPKGSRISGWTSKFKLVLSFTAQAEGENHIFMVFKAKVGAPNAFFGKPGVLATITDYVFASEMETVAVGPVHYEAAVFVNLKKFGDNEENARKLAVNLLTEEPESKWDVFGKYAFDKTRTRGKGDLVIKDPEEETPIETEASKALKTYFLKNKKLELDKKASLLLRLAKEGKYAPVLDTSTAGKAYRVLIFNQKTARGFLLQYGFDIADLDLGQTVVVRRGGILSPAGGFAISGWTTLPSAGNLDNINGLSNTAAHGAVVLFVADINSNNFFGRPGKLAASVGATGMEYEKEIIGVGDIKFEAMIIHKLKDEKQMPALEKVLAMISEL